jgi:thioredoxin-related protein
MNEEKITSRVKWATNVVVLLGALSLFAVATAFFIKTAPAREGISAGLETGRTFGNIKNVDFTANSRTLLVALNANCSQCAESVRLVHTLTEQDANKSYGDIRVVLLFTNGERNTATYLEQNNLNSERHVEIDFRSYRITSIPTIVLVDDKGVIKDFRTAMVSATETAEFLNTLKELNRRRYENPSENR